MCRVKTVHGRDVQLSPMPDKCPVCRHGIRPLFLNAIEVSNTKFWSGEGAQAMFQCPRRECQSLFIARYQGHFGSIEYSLYDMFPRLFVPTEFSEEIAKVSPSFVEIYNQALEAEQYKLPDGAGPGFRKSLEFLVKDFAISENKTRRDDIKALALGDVIKNYIADANIRACAERAAWVGNDWTHYERRWNQDLPELREIIKLVVNWVENAERTKKLLKKMPTGRPPRQRSARAKKP